MISETNEAVKLSDLVWHSVFDYRTSLIKRVTHNTHKLYQKDLVEADLF